MMRDAQKRVGALPKGGGPVPIQIEYGMGADVPPVFGRRSRPVERRSRAGGKSYPKFPKGYPAAPKCA